MDPASIAKLFALLVSMHICSPASFAAQGLPVVVDAYTCVMIGKTQPQDEDQKPQSDQKNGG